MSRYSKGANFERRVEDLFQSMGFSAARVAGSHGLYDVIAIAPNAEKIYFIQCKTDRKLPPADWNLLYAHATVYGGVAVLAYKDGVRIGLDWLTGYTKPYERRKPRSGIDYKDQSCRSDQRTNGRASPTVFEVSSPVDYVALGVCCAPCLDTGADESL